MPSFKFIMPGMAPSAEHILELQRYLATLDHGALMGLGDDDHPQYHDADKLDGLHAATSGANAHVVATDASGNMTVSGNVAASGTVTAPRTRRIWLPPHVWSVANNSPVLTVIGSWSTNFVCWQFDPTLNQHITTWFPVPSDWYSGQITPVIYWATPGTSGVCRWNTSMAVIANGSVVNPAYGAPLTIDRTAPSTAYALDRYQNSSPYSNTITDALVRIQIGRRGAETSDTLAENAYLLGMELVYTAAV